MARRKQKAIAVFPLGILRVVTQELCPERVSHRRRAQRQAGMPRLGLLHRVDRQRADCVDAKLIEFRGGVCDLLHFGAHDLGFKFQISGFKFGCFFAPLRLGVKIYSLAKAPRRKGLRSRNLRHYLINFS